MVNSRPGFQDRVKRKSALWKKDSRRAPLCGVHSIGQFRVLIEHERRRSDRTGDRFSVVVFSVENPDEDLRSLCLLPDLLVQSVRSTDEVGWFDKNQIGVLLLDTPPAGALKFLEKLLQRAPASWKPPTNQIYVYPSEELSRRPEESSQSQFLDMGEKMDSLGVSKTGVRRKSALREPVRDTDDRVERTKEAQDVPVSGLEPHLGIRIPLWKRIFDISVALAGLIFLSPLMVLVAVLIKTVSPGPVFYKQERIGYLGKPFTLLKFRTMHPETESSVHEDYVRTLINRDVPMKKLDRHREIIPFGKFLRSSGIDELPQLINVVCGEMSLVGPRPCLPVEFEGYLHWHKRRFYTLPGITGLWQVKGKHSLTFMQMIRYDITYEQQRSFWLDLKIIIGTFPTIYRLATDG